MNAEDMFKKAVALGADTIHFVPNALPMVRIRGKIMPLSEYAILTHDEIHSILELLCNDQQMQVLETEGVLNFGYSIPNVGRFRVNVVKQRGTYALVIKVYKLQFPSRESLGIPKQVYEKLLNSSGLFLVTGPSGSGKSTTLAALVKHIVENKHVHIMTIESPIEYLFKHEKGIVVQRDVGTDCQSIEEGLYSVMLNDPDVVMISSIEDDKALDMALRIAEAGKLVIAGYVTQNALTALERMMLSSSQSSSSLRRLQLANTLVGILSQQLLPKKDKDEQVMICELLLTNAAIKAHLSTNQLFEIHNSLIAGRKQGMISMDADLFDKYSQDLIHREVMYHYCHDADYIRRLENSKSRV